MNKAQKLKAWKAKNPEKVKAAQRKWRQANKAKINAYVMKRYAELRAWFSDYKKGLQCQRCGENHPACLHFHHRDPSKKRACVTKLFNGSTSLKNHPG